MNEEFRTLKERIRRLDALLTSRGATEDLAFAQALSSVHRAAKRGDRSRAPSPELLGLLERAEAFGRRRE
jgi:hypothetical protein